MPPTEQAYRPITSLLSTLKLLRRLNTAQIVHQGVLMRGRCAETLGRSISCCCDMLRVIRIALIALLRGVCLVYFAVLVNMNISNTTALICPM